MPPVWRQFTVPANISFHQFHQIIQIVFGWKNNRPYSFSPKGKGTVPQIKTNPDFSHQELNAETLKLNEIFSEKQKLYFYTYDFADNWEHVIHLEKIVSDQTPEIDLQSGKGACPVEGCDGIWGYERVKKFLRNPESDEWHEVMFEMFGYLIEEKFNPDEFDMDGIREKLKKL